MPPRQSENLVMPPPECPNGGLCLVVLPRIEAAELRIKTIEETLETLHGQSSDIKGLQIIQKERDQVFDFIKKVFIAILVAVVMQVGTTIWWAAKLQAAIDTAREVIGDHELRLRAEERETTYDNRGKNANQYIEENP
jgi:hypothetical protein